MFWGYACLIVCMFLLIFLVYKGASNVYAAPICAVLVAFFCGLPLSDTFKNVYLGGIADWMPVGFSFAVLGACFGHVYSVSHGAGAIGRALFALWDRAGRMSHKKKVLVSLFTMSFIQSLLTFTGISGTVVLLSSIPIAKAFSRMAHIPVRYLPAMMMSSGASAAMAAPGVPTIGNLTASEILGTSAAAGLASGIFSYLFVFIFGNLYLYHRIIKEPEVSYDEQKMQQEDHPAVLVALIPLGAVFLLYTFAGADISTALSVGILLAVILMRKNLPGTGWRKYADVLNDGFQTGSIVFFQIASLMGFAAVIQHTNGFQKIVEKIGQLEMHPYMTVFVTIVLLTFLTASPPAAISMGISILLPLAEQRSITVDALHRITVIGATTFESMPYSGAAILAMKLSGVSHKDGYPPVFVCTVLIPLAATFLTSVMYAV